MIGVGDLGHAVEMLHLSRDEPHRPDRQQTFEVARVGMEPDQGEGCPVVLDLNPIRPALLRRRQVPADGDAHRQRGSRRRAENARTKPSVGTALWQREDQVARSGHINLCEMAGRAWADPRQGFEVGKERIQRFGPAGHA